MNASSVTPIPVFRKVWSLVAVVIIAMPILLGIAQPASAASNVCCVNVQADAAARSTPEVGYNFRGYVTPDNWWVSAQKSLVRCYQDGGWATGNYHSNRWFKVYVTTSYGYTNWFFVHSSYVYNQKPVPRC